MMFNKIIQGLLNKENYYSINGRRIKVVHDFKTLNEYGEAFAAYVRYVDGTEAILVDDLYLKAPINVQATLRQLALGVNMCEENGWETNYLIKYIRADRYASERVGKANVISTLQYMWLKITSDQDLFAKYNTCLFTIPCRLKDLGYDADAVNSMYITFRNGTTLREPELRDLLSTTTLLNR